MSGRRGGPGGPAFRPVQWVAGGALLIVSVAACSSGDDGSEEPDPTAPAEEPAPSGDETSTDEPAADETVTEETEPAVTPVDILTDFGDVCRGVSLPGATAYDPAVPGPHPVVAITGEGTDFDPALSDLPDTWDPVIGQEATVELVACLARTEATLAQTCDGYQDDDGGDTGNVVEMYDTTYDVRLIAATTGEEVASTELQATGEDCPFLVFFDEGEKVKPWYSEPTDALVAFLAEFVEG